MVKKILIAVVWFFFVNPVGYAALTIEINEGIEEALPIAIVPFGWQATATVIPPQNMASIISANLHRTGRFQPLAEKNMLAKPAAVSNIQYQNWRTLEIPYLVIGVLTQVSNAQYIVEFRLMDVYREKQLKAFRYPSVSAPQLRKIAHMISDVIYEELTGEKGAFNTRLAYVKVFPRSVQQRYQLMFADSDKENATGVFRSKNPMMSLTWSPNHQKIAFVMLRPAGSVIKIHTINSPVGPEDVVKFQGINSAPAWSADGKKLAFTSSKDGNAEIYVMELKSRKIKRITNRWVIDTEATWSPDGKNLVFTSERGGSPQLYRYEFASNKVSRLTFEGKQNLRASYSPDGKMITFVHLAKRRGPQRIAVMELDNMEMRILTESDLDESPSFSPNGRMIIYSTIYQGRGALSAVSLDGRVHNRFPIDGEGEEREPAWSSYLSDM